MSKILYVDDEPDLCRLFSRIAQSLDIEHSVAASGAEALLFCERTPFAAAVLDLHMPQMSGVELAAALRSRYSDMLIFAFSGNLMDLRSDNALLALFDGSFCKSGSMSRMICEILKGMALIEHSDLFERGQPDSGLGHLAPVGGGAADGTPELARKVVAV